MGTVFMPFLDDKNVEQLFSQHLSWNRNPPESIALCVRYLDGGQFV